MNSSPRCSRISPSPIPPSWLSWPFALVILAIFVASPLTAHAQSAPYQTNQNLTPQIYNGYSVPLPTAYLLHFTDWPFLTGTNALPPNAGLQRVNGGANWNQIETARGTYSSTLGSLYFSWTGSCAAVSGSGSNNGWVMAADCNNTNPTITEGGSTKIAGNLLYSFNTVPAWASGGGSADPPSDIYTWTESCPGTDVYLGGTGANAVYGDCYFREFVTKLMEYNCPNADGTPRTSIPPAPLHGGCAIHYFEGWNEFNADNYWTGSYTKLAEMMVDADEIIKQFCGDCYFIAGSVSAGGDGYHQNFPTGADGSAVYSEALGQLLHDWYYQTDATSPRYPTPIYPDAISFHPYPSRDNLLNPPMPETNLSYNDASHPGCYPGSAGTLSGINEPVKYTGSWSSEPHPGFSCRDSVISAIVEIQNVISQLPSSYNFPSVPVWNTESGIGPIFSSDQGTQTTTASAHDPYDASLTAFLDQSYLARQSILTASSGDALNLWYQADNTQWAPLFYLPAKQWLKNNTYNSGTFIWDGQSIQKATSSTGTSGATFPSFNHSGGTTTDGTVTWTNVTTNWTPTTNYSTGDIVWDGSHLQEALCSAQSGTSQPGWSATQGGTIFESTGRNDCNINGVLSDLKWEDVVATPHIVSGTSSHPFATPMGRTFNQVYTWFHGRNIQFTGIPGSSLKTYAHNTAYSVNDLVSQGGLLHRVAKAGTSGTSGPTWSQGMYNVTADGGVTWEVVGTPKCYDTSTFTGTLNSYGQGTIATQSVWTCPVSETVNGTGYTGNLVWFTPRETTTQYAVPPGTNCIWDIDGNELSRKYPANMTVFNRPALIDNYVDGVCTAP